MTTNTNAAQVAKNLIAVAEDQAFEAWYKQDCLVGGVNARIAARAAWNARAALTTAAAVPPEGWVHVPVYALKRWRAAFAEELAAYDIDPPIHHVKASHDEIAQLLAAAPKAEPVPAVQQGDDLQTFAIGDSNYAAGMLLGWNLCTAGMDAEFSRIREDRMRAAVQASRAAHPAAPVAQRDADFEAVRKKLCALQRYSFVLDDDGVVRRVQDRTGKWIEFDDAHELFDPVAVDAAIAAQAKEGA